MERGTYSGTWGMEHANGAKGAAGLVQSTPTYSWGLCQDPALGTLVGSRGNTLVKVQGATLLEVLRYLLKIKTIRMIHLAILKLIWCALNRSEEFQFDHVDNSISNSSMIIASIRIIRHFNDESGLVCVWLL